MTPKSKRSDDSTEDYEISPEDMRVLVVDSDRNCLEIVSEILKLCGYQERAEEALSIARNRKDDLHLVLMEVVLPDMNRYELLEKMAEVSNLPIVIMSSDENEKAMLGGLFKGAVLYLVKPIKMNDVRNLWQFSFMKRIADRRSTPEQPKSWRRDPEFAGEISDSGFIRKPKLIWTEELHTKFVQAVNDLGIERAHPKDILHLMNVPGIKKDNISSHLQKYRLALKRRLAGGSSRSSLISSYPPLTLNLQEISQSSNQIEMNSADSFISIPALPFEAHPYLDPLLQTTPSSYPFLNYDMAAEFAEIGGFNGGRIHCQTNMFDPENYSVQKLREEEQFPQPPPPPPFPTMNGEMQPGMPFYLPLMGEGDGGQNTIFLPPLATEMQANQNGEGNVVEIGSTQSDDLLDVFGVEEGFGLPLHDEDLMNYGKL